MWVLYAILAMGSNAARNIISKRTVDTNDAIIGTWSALTFGFMVASVYVLFTGINITDNTFWMIIAIRIVGDILATWTYFKALERSQVSVVIPLTALLPVLTLGTSAFINNQAVSPLQLLGVVLISVSTVTLLAMQARKDKSTEQLDWRGVMFMAITVVLWSFMETFHKLGVDASNPATYFFFSYAGFAAITSLGMALWRWKQLTSLITTGKVWELSPNGLVLGIERVFSLHAVVQGPVASVAAIKFSSVIWTAFLAAFILQERLTVVKIVTTIGTVVGVILVIV
jgi:drug/metabolite transporter (DMT)-like permease